MYNSINQTKLYKLKIKKTAKLHRITRQMLKLPDGHGLFNCFFDQINYNIFMLLRSQYCYKLYVIL